MIFSSSAVFCYLKCFIFGHALFFHFLLLSRVCVNVFPKPRIFRRSDKMHSSMPNCFTMTFQLLNNREGSQLNLTFGARVAVFASNLKLNIRQDILLLVLTNPKRHKCFVKSNSNVFFSYRSQSYFPLLLNELVTYSSCSSMPLSFRSFSFDAGSVEFVLEKNSRSACSGSGVGVSKINVSTIEPLDDPKDTLER